MPDGILTQTCSTLKYRCHSTPKKWNATTTAQRMAALCFVVLRQQIITNLHNQTLTPRMPIIMWCCFVPGDGLFFLEWLSFFYHLKGATSWTI
jgi:hypothetical protein